MNTITEMSVGESFLYSLVGLLVVFLTLVLLAALVMLISKLVANFAAKKAPDSDKPAPAAASAAPATAVPTVSVNKPAVMASQGELKLRNVDDQTAALLMAIVAEQTKIPLNELRFKSIVCLNP